MFVPVQSIIQKREGCILVKS